MAKNKLIDFFNGYEQPLSEEGEQLPIGKRFYVREISGSATRNTRRHSKSRIYDLISLLPRLFTYTKSSVYGLAALIFGFSVLAVHFLGFYLGVFADISTATLVMGAVFCVFGTGFLFVDKPLPIMLQDSPFFDFIFFEFFCIQRVHRKTGEASIHPAAAVLAGLFGAVISCFVPAEWISAVIGFLLFVLIAFGSPEFSYVASLITLPYLGLFPAAKYVFYFVILLTAVSFLRKVYQGKRVIYFEQYDALITALVVLILISGIFIKGVESFTASAVLMVMSLGYFLTSNVITNRRLADRAMNAVVVSSVPASIAAIVSYVVKSAKAGELVRPAEGSVLGSSSVFATLLIVAACFSVAHATQTHATVKKITYYLAALITVAVLFLTGETFALFAFVLGGISLVLFKIKGLLPLFLLPLLFILPFGIYLLPTELLEGLFDFIPSSPGYSESLAALLESLKSFGSNFLFGIGIGTESFVQEMQGKEILLNNSGNLFLELALEAGVLSLIVFVSLVVSRARHVAKYRIYVKGSVVKHSQPLVSMALFSLLFYGLFSYIWADTSMFYLFFVVFGIESAMLRLSRRDRDERVLYYALARSNESAAIDVGLEED